MSLLSPSEDFQSRSVARLGGVFEKLLFVAGLRNNGQQYSHWGMEQAHGKDATLSALAAVHTVVWVDLMRHKIRDLEQDLAQLKAEWKSIRQPAVVPENTAGATERHYDYLVEAVTSLQKSSKDQAA